MRRRRRRSNRNRKARVNKKSRYGLKRGCGNREIRGAINTLSGWVHFSGHRGRKNQSPQRVKSAIDTLTSCDLTAGAGRRGGITRGNVTAGLRYIAAYELKTGKKIRKTGGFGRKVINQAKKQLRSNKARYGSY